MVARLTGILTIVALAAFVSGCTKTGNEPTDSASAGGGAEKSGGGGPDDENAKWADHTQHLPFIIGYEKGLAEAKAQDKPMMLFVTTTWCGWCKKHADENFNDESVRDLLDKFVLVIVDGDTESDAMAKLGANQGFPHLIFQTAAGKTLGEQLGYAPVAEFKKVVESALAKAKSA